MRLTIRLPIAIALILVAAASAFPREVKSDYDHHATFSQYKTYSWAKIETPNPLWNDRVKETVDRELAAKGWTQVPSDGDVSIVAIGTTRDKPTLQTFYDGFDGWLWNGFGDATTYVEHYTEGTLVIDMFDTKSKKLVWRGSVSDMLSDKPEKNIKELDTSVHKLFDRFPPRRRSGSLSPYCLDGKFAFRRDRRSGICPLTAWMENHCTTTVDYGQRPAKSYDSTSRF